MLRAVALPRPARDTTLDADGAVAQLKRAMKYVHTLACYRTTMTERRNYRAVECLVQEVVFAMHDDMRVRDMILEVSRVCHPPLLARPR